MYGNVLIFCKWILRNTLWCAYVQEFQASLSNFKLLLNFTSLYSFTVLQPRSTPITLIAPPAQGEAASVAGRYFSVTWDYHSMVRICKNRESVSNIATYTSIVYWCLLTQFNNALRTVHYGKLYSRMQHDATLLILESWRYSTYLEHPKAKAIFQLPAHKAAASRPCTSLWQSQEMMSSQIRKLGQARCSSETPNELIFGKKKTMDNRILPPTHHTFLAFKSQDIPCTLHVETASLCINPFLKISNSMRTNQHDANMYYMILYACLLGILINVGNVGNSLMFY